MTLVHTPCHNNGGHLGFHEVHHHNKPKYGKFVSFYNITKTCPYNKQRIVSVLLKTLIENFVEKFDIFNIFAQNNNCGYRRGSSNEYPQSMFWIKNKKDGYTPVDSSFTI